MTVLFDSTAILVLLAPPERVQANANGRPIPDARKRLDYLVTTHAASKEKIIIPTPALSEALVRAGMVAAQDYIARLSRSPIFEIKDFDAPAALEAAMRAHEALVAGQKRGEATGDWQKVKVDRQIVAIASVWGVSTIYSNDGDVAALAKAVGIPVVGLETLQLAPKDRLTPIEEAINEDLKS